MDSDQVVLDRGEGCKLLLLLGEVDDGVVLVVIGRGRMVDARQVVAVRASP